MLIKADWLIRYWGVKPEGVVHVGAHLAEELSSYKRLNFGTCLWVEANPNLIPILKRKLANTKDILVEAAVWEESGKKVDLNIASNSLSTSLFEFGLHRQIYPSVITSEVISVQTRRLDEIIPLSYKFNFINLDIQGAEMSALKSLGSRTPEVHYIFSEVNKKNLYKDAPSVRALDEFLGNLGFKRQITFWVPFAGWGDALYVSEKVNKNSPVLRLIGKAKVQITRTYYILSKTWRVIYIVPAASIKYRTQRILKFMKNNYQ